MTILFSQKDKVGQLHTALAFDYLCLLRFDGHSGVNDLFEFNVEALCADPNINLAELIGTHATLVMDSMTGEKMLYDGVVAEAEWTGPGENGHTYNLVLRPWFWLGTRRRNQRIFHNMTVVDIVEEVLGEQAGAQIETRLSESYPELEYTVQYRESDFAFVARQLERHGIHYFFTHEMGSHTMVLADSMDHFDTVHQAEVPYYPVDGQNRPPEEHFWHWQPRRTLTTGAISQTDYNFKTPVVSMMTNQMGDADYAASGDIESYDYPGDYLDSGRGGTVSRTRIKQERSDDHYHSAVGDVIGLNAGFKVTVGGMQEPGILGEEFLCVRTDYSFKSQTYGSGKSGDDGHPYTASYLLTPVDQPYSPSRVTARPIVHGPQTAVVVGPAGEEIHCDEYGRIKVRFHWDRLDARSMWCRVSQNWASKGWGGMVIPRVNMEVVVEFLEGDPDQPLVTGCVYNGKNSPPYSLPANKTKSVFKTDTHKGSGFNELTFEDEKDQELIWMHGQKDQSIQINNNRDKNIGNDQFESVGRDKSISVGQDHTEAVGRDARHNVGQDVNYTVGRDQIENYGKDHVHNVGNIHKQAIFADHLIDVGRNVEQNVSGKFTLNVVESITNNTGKHTLMAYEKFVIKGPGCAIELSASGIVLKAAKIDLKGMVSMGGSGSAQVPTLSGAANKALPLVEECPKEGE